LFGASFCAISAHHPIATKLAETDAGLKDFIAECAKNRHFPGGNRNR